jgi:hypothetical protein
LKNLVLAAVIALSPTVVPAESYVCDTVQFSPDGWIPSRIILGLDRTENVASAFDYFINLAHKAPIPVKLEKRSDTSYKFSWKFRNLKLPNQRSVGLSHTVVLNTANGTFNMRGILHGYDNVINGSGTCELIK